MALRDYYAWALGRWYWSERTRQLKDLVQRVTMLHADARHLEGYGPLPGGLPGSTELDEKIVRSFFEVSEHQRFVERIRSVQIGYSAEDWSYQFAHRKEWYAPIGAWQRSLESAKTELRGASDCLVRIRRARQ